MSLDRFHFNVARDAPAASAGIPGIRSVSPGQQLRRFGSDEAAARFHLSQLFGVDDRPGLRTITAADRPEQVPDLRLVGVQDMAATNTRLVRFEQVQQRIPVFGSHAVCELTADRAMLSAVGGVGEVPDSVQYPATLTAQNATYAVANLVGHDLPMRLAELTYFELDGKWSLAWLLRDVPAAPPEAAEHSHGHGFGASPRIDYPLYDFLVDAHHGHILYFYSAVPRAMAGGLPPIPVNGTGVGEDGIAEMLWGRMEGVSYELWDPSRDVVTYDLALGGLGVAQPTAPFASPGSQLGDTAKAAVSAHANATRIFDFLTGVLQRDSIDGAGMQLVNVVNVTYGNSAPAWPNAVWYQQRMWYGQAPDASGNLASYARFLDVVAHEMAHGITKTTADLVYKDQSGALNESISDIFGVIIQNWYAHPPDGGSTLVWDWQLGAGLAANGGPLRNMSDPSVTGDPAHMDDYVHTTDDEGGVHTNSNIHNKVAYNLATAVGASGATVFSPREVALLYYLALVRLGKLDGFDAALAALVDVATAMYAGDAAVRDARIATIRDAYAAAGIT